MNSPSQDQAASSAASRGRFRWVAIVAIVLAASFAVWKLWSSGSDQDILARVGDSEITLARFNRSYLQFLMGSGSADTPAGRRGHLEKMIQDRLLAQEARRRGTGLGEDYDRLVDRQRLLAAGGRYFNQEFAASLPELTELQVRDAYEKSTQKVIIRQLYFRTPEEARAASKRLEEGQGFVDLANEVFQTAEYDSMAGYLGVATYWDLDDPVADAVFELGQGEVSPPVRSSQGWHIFRLEDRLVNPILIEEDYQRRRASIEGRAVIRRNRLQGDAWVRALMEGADVQVNEAGMRLLALAVDQALNQESEEGQRPPRMLVSEFDELRGGLRPETPLLLYSMDGQDHTFTAADFYRWVPELAYNEIRDAPAAAVGRALRNEILGLKGLESGLDSDPMATEAVQSAADLYLANRMRTELRTSGRVEPTESQVQEAFTRLGYGKLTEGRASYWIIPFESFDRARQAQEEIKSGSRLPTSFPAYRSVTDEDVLMGSLQGHVRRMALREPLVVCLADYTCNVVEVTDRTLVRQTLEDVREDIVRRLRAILPEEQLTDSLRQATEVWINEELFMANMEAQ